MIFPVLCSCLITAWLVCRSADDKYKRSGSGVARPSSDSETRSPGVEAGGPRARPEVLVISEAGDTAEVSVIRSLQQAGCSTISLGDPLVQERDNRNLHINGIFDINALCVAGGNVTVC